MAGKSKTPWQLTRLLMVLCWLVWIVTFFITVTLLQAVLQVRVTAQVAQAAERGFISFSDDFTQFVPLNVANLEKIDEALVRYYLEMRYAIIPDEVEMERRWGPRGMVAFLSTPRAYRAFKEPSQYLEKIESMRPRVVDIISLKREKDLRYSAVIDVYEYDGSRSWRKQTKSLFVGFTYMPSHVYLGSHWPANPKGFVVSYVNDSKVAN